MTITKTIFLVAVVSAGLMSYALNRERPSDAVCAQQRQAVEVHHQSADRHKVALERYNANPTADNKAALWRAYEETWPLYKTTWEKYTQCMDALKKNGFLFDD